MYPQSLTRSEDSRKNKIETKKPETKEKEKGKGKGKGKHNKQTKQYY